MPPDRSLDELAEGSTSGDVVLGVRERLSTGLKTVDAKVIERSLNAATTALLLVRREDRLPATPRGHVVTLRPNPTSGTFTVLTRPRAKTENKRSARSSATACSGWTSMGCVSRCRLRV